MIHWTNESINQWMGELVSRWVNQSVNQWMGEWVSWWISESVKSMNGCISESVNQWGSESMNQWMNEGRKERTKEGRNEWMKEGRKEWMHAWMDGWMSEPFLCWSTSSLRDLFAEVPLLSEQPLTSLVSCRHPASSSAVSAPQFFASHKLLQCV